MLNLKLRWLLLIFFTSLITSSYAQKNRSMADDAATILEILQRDYFQIENPETRLNSIQDDRVKIISIFKAYTLQFKTDSAFTSTTSLDKNADLYRLQLTFPKPTDAAAVDKALTNIETALYKYDIQIIEDLKTYFSDRGKSPNPLLHDVLVKLSAKFAAVNGKSFDVYATSIGSGTIEKGITSFASGLSFTEAIDGLATFMAKRIKEELATQVFDKIKSELSATSANAHKYEELKVLLPRTVHLLNTVQPYEYQGIINSLKETIEADLNELFENIPRLESTPKMKNLISRNPDLVLIFDGLQLINDLNKSRSTTEIIFTLESSDLVQRMHHEERFKDFANGVKLASLLVNATTEIYPDGRRFVSVNEWEKQFKNVDFNGLFFGFLIQQDINYYNIRFKGHGFSENLLKGTTALKGYYDTFGVTIRQIAQSASAVEDEAGVIKRLLLENKKVSHDTIAHFLNASLTLLDSIFAMSDQVSARFMGDGLKIRQQSSNYIAFGRTAIDIYSNLGSKKYFNALLEAISLVEKAKASAKIGNFQPVVDKYHRVAEVTGTVLLEIQANKVTQETINLTKALAGDFKKCGCNDFDFLGSVSLPLSKENADKLKSLADNLKGNTYAPYFSCVFLEVFKDEVEKSGFSLSDYPGLQKTLTGLQNRSADDIVAVFDAARNDIMQKIQLVADPDIMRMLNFIIAVSKAQNAEDFEEAIQAIVLPAGSAILKRESMINLSINAYPGFFFGREYIHQVDDSGASTFAITAPIGVAFSASLSKGKKPASLTFFASAIDIGAFTSIRFNSEDAPLPEITFKNILAPGAHLILGLPKSSFSIGLSAQYGPVLREVRITKDDNGVDLPVAELDERPAYRFGISLMMDIPLMNIYTKSKSFRTCD